MNLYDQILEALAAVRKRTSREVEVGLILGSGLGSLAEGLEDSLTIPYAEIPHFARATVHGHAGELVLGRLDGLNVAVLKGRLHHYEGHSLQQVTFPVRLLRALGATTLVLTNSSGGLNPEYQPGDLMLIRDHINFMGGNPLIGANDERLGVRFPPMSRAYCQELCQLALDMAQRCGVPLHQGVYLGLTGPSFETPAEIAAFRCWGADALGMSTVPEAIVANHAGMRVLGLACITNILHAGPSDDTHIEVLEQAHRSSSRLLSIVRGCLGSLASQRSQVR